MLEQNQICPDKLLAERDKVNKRMQHSDDLTADKLDANPCADAIQMEPRHQRGHAEQQVIQKPSVSVYLPASAAQSWSVPLHKGQSVEGCSALKLSSVLLYLNCELKTMYTELQTHKNDRL